MKLPYFVDRVKKIEGFKGRKFFARDPSVSEIPAKIGSSVVV